MGRRSRDQGKCRMARLGWGAAAVCPRACQPEPERGPARRFVVREGVGFVVPASRGFGYLVVSHVLRWHLSPVS